MPGKNPTIKSLKIGDAISFGAYSAQGRGENPVPIIWVKASTNCDFITEHIVDLLTFSVQGGMRVVNGIWTHDHVDPVYQHSTILRFLNSNKDGDEWFHPANENDIAPAYVHHAGFLRYFTADELNAIIYRRVADDPFDVLAPVHLMAKEDVFGDNMIPIFRKRRGIRAKPTRDLYLSSRCFQTPGHYMEYMTRTRESGRIVCVGRDAALHQRDANVFNGIRPLVQLNPDAKIAMGEDGMWHVVAKRGRYHSPPSRPTKSDLSIPDDVLGLLGLV